MKIEGEFLNWSDLDNDYCSVEVDSNYLLEVLDDDDIEDYARDNLNMIYEDAFESDLDDFTDKELVDELEYRGYNFSSLIGEYDCIDFLEESGYTITYGETTEGSLDVIDANMLDEIITIFKQASVFEREEIYNLIKNK